MDLPGHMFQRCAMMPYGSKAIYWVDMPVALAAIREPSGQSRTYRESAVVDLWRNAHVLSEGLVAEDGRLFRVVYPGRPGGSSGPDFRDCVIETDVGERLTGDVEVHVAAPSWDQHRHHLDPNYNGVVLHVVMRPEGRKSSDQQSKTTTPVASLAAVTDVLQTEGPLRSAVAVGLSSGQKSLGELLDEAGDQRFQARSRGFSMELRDADPEEVLYCAVMEALGYAANRKPFRELAQAVPFERLSSLRGEPRATRLLAIKALLLNAAGLLSLVTPDEEGEQLGALVKYLPSTRKIDPGRWRLTGARPANHPVRRIQGAANLIDRHIDSGLVLGFEEAIANGAARILTGRLTVRPHIGSGRAREIAVNVALPFIHARAVLGGDADSARLPVELYRSFPGLPDNGITREMKRVLDPENEALDLAGARRHQGLIHLYRAMKGRVA